MLLRKTQMRKIQLTQGKEAIIDDEDFELVSKHKWHCVLIGGSSYACNNRKEYLHRVLMNPNIDKMVDHVNGNGLDCRRSNMRLCIRQENHRNLRKSTNNTSGFKGVCFDITRNKWKASIGHERKKIHIGYFNSKEEAAINYDKKSSEIFGNFACTNKSMV